LTEPQRDLLFRVLALISGCHKWIGSIQKDVAAQNLRDLRLRAAGFDAHLAGTYVNLHRDFADDIVALSQKYNFTLKSPFGGFTPVNSQT